MPYSPQFALLVPEDQAAEPFGITPDNPEQGFSLAECYAHLDCEAIDIVRFTPPLPGSPEWIAIIDDNGRINGRGFNLGASFMCNVELFGTVILCPSGWLK
jgi:hypothetical protein